MISYSTRECRSNSFALSAEALDVVPEGFSTLKNVMVETVLGASATINSGTGHDTVSIMTCMGDLVVDLGDGMNSLVLETSGADGSSTTNIMSGKDKADVLIYKNLGSLTIQAENGNNNVTVVENEGPCVIETGNGTDVVVVESNIGSLVGNFGAGTNDVTILSSGTTSLTSLGGYDTVSITNCTGDLSTNCADPR